MTAPGQVTRLNAAAIGSGGENGDKNNDDNSDDTSNNNGATPARDRGVAGAD